MLSTIVSDSSIEKHLGENRFEIVHATRGHLRLRLPELKNNPVFAARLEYLMRSLEFVKTVHINTPALSLTIDFNPHLCSEQFLLERVAIAIHRAGTVLPTSHTTAALAQRLGVTSQSITWHRTQSDFAEWSRSHDPEGLAWNYDIPSKSFYTGGHGYPIAVQDRSKGQRILEALQEAAGARMGAAMGRMAGQAIGLLLLGTAGMALGAEVGTFVGEIVGAELAAVEALEVAQMH